MGTLWKDHAFANLVTLVPTAKVKVIRLLSNTKASWMPATDVLEEKEQTISLIYATFFTCINKKRRNVFACIFDCGSTVKE